MNYRSVGRDEFEAATKGTRRGHVFMDTCHYYGADGEIVGMESWEDGHRASHDPALFLVARALKEPS